MEKLATEGGTPVRNKKLPMVLPFFGKEEIRAVTECIESTWISSDGPKGRELEGQLQKYLKVKHAILVNNCTSAMHLGLWAADIRGGNTVIPDYTFTSTGLAPLAVQSKPKMIDVEYETANIDPNKIKITKETRAIIPVHYAGHAADLEPIIKKAKEENVLVIEDAAQALGSEYKEKKLGTIGDIGCFSFHAVKNITCGEGGALVTNNDEIAKKARIIRDKGTNKAEFNIHKNIGFYDYVMEGHNFMFSDILAALTLEQLKKIEEINRRRTANSQYLIKELEKLNKKNLILPIVKKYTKTNWNLFTIRVKEDISKVTKALNAEGITANIHFTPLHLTTLYKKYINKEEKFPVSEKVYGSLIRLPMYPGLTKEELDDIVKAVDKVIQ